ncbi:hypothetical protein MTP99_011197 [Tenebrio molitor]|nr:hypothetical protein MTP99_011197 [Tenebrio molitor]
MPNLEYNESIPKGRLLLKSSRCERNDLEKYYCKHCNFETDLVTKRKDHLQRHEKSHLSADASQWYSCDKCEYKAKRKDYLTQHQKNHVSANHKIAEHSILNKRSKMKFHSISE